jgi:type I restriction-modification system DNA methylase subunit
MTTFGTNTVNNLIGVKESYQAPDALMKIVWDRPKREKLFREFLKVSTNVREDWFRDYFQDVQADRKQQKQDFTPQSIIDVLTKITSKGSEYYEVAAGTGGIVVSKWYQDMVSLSPFAYRPSMFFYHLEELSEAALPFLLFNLLIRGINATVVHGDSLERTVKQVYFIQNDDDDFLKFSSLNVMPHSDAVAREFDVRHWLESEKKHIESDHAPILVENVMEKMRGEASGK